MEVDLHTQSPTPAHVPAERALALLGVLAQFSELFGIVKNVGEALPFAFSRRPEWISRLAIIVQPAREALLLL